MTLNEYLEQVVVKVELLGYDIKMVKCFFSDIKQHYEDGLSVDECIEIEF